MLLQNFSDIAFLSYGQNHLTQRTRGLKVKGVMKMAITRWNPIREMLALQTALDRMFEENGIGAVDGGNTLALDIHENDQNYTVVTSMPGVQPENINVTLHDGVLTITGTIPAQSRENIRVLVQERRYGQFTRSIRLPMAVDSNKVEASFENGVLTLTLPKTPEAQPKQIQVRVGNNNQKQLKG
jgi:HSP20 family protein